MKVQIEVNKEDLINLKSRIGANKRLVEGIKRKRKVRLSEKAMWLVEVNSQTNTLQKILSATGQEDK